MSPFPVFGIAVAVLFLCSGSALPNGEFKYVGALKCKACHLKQYNIWKESPHSTAFEKLSKEDRKRDECLSCHVTGLGEETEGKPKLNGVQCEVCHGPGSLYRKPTVMSKVKYKADPETQRQVSIEAGLVLPTEATCTGCHNEKSPNFKGFDFEKAKEKIRHWNLD